MFHPRINHHQHMHVQSLRHNPTSRCNVNPAQPICRIVKTSLNPNPPALIYTHQPIEAHKQDRPREKAPSAHSRPQPRKSIADGKSIARKARHIHANKRPGAQPASRPRAGAPNPSHSIKSASARSESIGSWGARGPAAG